MRRPNEAQRAVAASVAQRGHQRWHLLAHTAALLKLIERARGLPQLLTRLQVAQSGRRAAALAQRARGGVAKRARRALVRLQHFCRPQLGQQRAQRAGRLVVAPLRGAHDGR